MDIATVRINDPVAKLQVFHPISHKIDDLHSALATDLDEFPLAHDDELHRTLASPSPANLCFSNQPWAKLARAVGPSS
jgi:hypothetical protein